MVFKFELKNMSNDEIRIIPDFCEYLLKNIKKDISRNANYIKIDKYEKYLINSKMIRWTNDEKPKSIDMNKLCNYIIRNFECVSLKGNSYSIQLKRNVRIPESRTSIDKIARLLDKGNGLIVPTLFISKVINYYTRNINKFWRSFVSLKLKSVDVKRCIKIV